MENFNDIFKKLLNGDVDNPDLLSKYIIQLSAHLYNLGAEKTKTQQEYARLWESERSKYKTNKETEIALYSSKQYEELEKSKNAYTMTKELIIAARKRLVVLSDISHNNY